MDTWKLDMKGWFHIVALRKLLASNRVDSIWFAIREGVQRYAREEYKQELMEIVSNPRMEKTISRAIDDTARMMKVNNVDDLDDAAQEAAMMFISKPKIFSLKPLSVGHKVESYFYLTIKNMMMWKLRNSKRDMIPIQNLRDDSEEFIRYDFSENEFVSIVNDLKEYVLRHTKNDLEKEMFLVWFNLSQVKGQDNVDVISIVRNISDKTRQRFEIGDGRIPSLIYPKWNNLKKRMVEYFEGQLHIQLTDDLKRRLHVANIITLEFSRRKLAAWVLGLSYPSLAA